MSRVAVVGGSGLNEIPDFTLVGEHRPITPYGQPSGPILQGRLAGRELFFLARHGIGHTIPPHRINYRANIAALKALEITDVVAVTAVGGIASNAAPGAIAIPQQIIDYTYGREHTFFDGLDLSVKHIDFTAPFDQHLTETLVDAATEIKLSILNEGTYGATQGPRLETAAEITRMARDGCTLVGMTGMPEAALAREADLNYVNCSLVVNWAAGLGDGVIAFDEIERCIASGMTDVMRLISAWLMHEKHRAR